MCQPPDFKNLEEHSTLLFYEQLSTRLPKKTKTCRNNREGDTTQLTVQTGQMRHEKNTN